jgi:MYXO-CTERM domain-containing protein
VTGSDGLVISAFYGGGTGATFNRDYVELFNRGTKSVTLDGLSLQYGSAAGFIGTSTGGTLPLPKGVTIAPGRYFLVALAKGASGADLAATPDFEGTTMNLSGTNGKIALAKIATPLGCGSSPDAGASDAGTPGRCPSQNIIDMVGYGTASDYEGPAGSAAAALNATTSGQRKTAGCTDTDVNTADFAPASPAAAPRNNATAANPCSAASDAGKDAPTDDGGTVTDGSADDGSSDDGATADSGPPPARGDGEGLVISQVFGAGGVTGAAMDRDFVELFNRSSKAASLWGLSIQYGADKSDFGADNTDGSTNILALPNVMVAPGKYVLVGLSKGTGTSSGAASPKVDVDGALQLGDKTGKVALARIIAPLGCGGTTHCPTRDIVDYVGYGSASDSEGSTPVPALSATTAAIRKSAGCTDTDSNSTDFDVLTPAPRSSASSSHECPKSGGADAAPPPDDNEDDDAGVTLGGGGGSHRDAGSHTDAGDDPGDEPGENLGTGGGKTSGCSVSLDGKSAPDGAALFALGALTILATRRRKQR